MFDEISHPALLAPVHRRIADKRVLGLVKAFLKAGVLSEQGISRDTKTGTPQGGILFPLLANIASVLDEHFAQIWQTDMATRVDRARRRRHGLATYRVVRYADDFVVMVCGSRRHAEAIREQIIPVLASVGLRLSEEKTTIIHLDEGFEFFGFRIQCKPNGARAADTSTPGSRNGRSPSIKTKVKTITKQCTNNPLKDLLRQLNPVLRGWTNYFQRHRMAATQAPPRQLEADPPTSRRLVAPGRRHRTVRHSNRARHPLPLRRRGHPHPRTPPRAPAPIG